MKLELKAPYSSNFKLNQIIYITLNRFKPEEETPFYVHEIKAESIIVHDVPKQLRMRKLFVLALYLYHLNRKKY